MGFWETTNSVFQTRHKSQPLYQIPGLEIALHSPVALLETGPRRCLPEKRPDGHPVADEKSVLCSPVCPGIIAKYGQLSRISAQIERKSFAVQTAWKITGNLRNFPSAGSAPKRPINESFQGFLPVLCDTASVSWLEIGDIRLSHCFPSERQLPTSRLLATGKRRGQERRLGARNPISDHSRIYSVCY